MALPEELVKEILLRLPPAEPACLFRTAVVCKPWRRLISDARFRRQLRQFHRPPPNLGFICNTVVAASGYVACFVPAAASSRLPLAAHHHGSRRWWRALGVCHGLVLLHDGFVLDHMPNPFKTGFVIWDTITDHREELPLLLPPLVQRQLDDHDPYSWNAALVCACDHHDCHGPPFLVVLVATMTTIDMLQMFTYIYSSEAGAWGQPTEHPHLPYTYTSTGVAPDHPSVFVGNALYFLSWLKSCIFKYDFDRRQMSVILLPVGYSLGQHTVLMAMEDGRLGFATLVSSKLSLWSWEAVGGTHAGWAVSRVIDLKALLPAIGEPTTKSFMAGCAGSAVIFVFVDGGIFTFDLNSCEITEVCRASCSPANVYPYRRFCTPGDGPGAGASSS